MIHIVKGEHSTFVTLGASNHTNHERAEHDYYATDPIAIDKLADARKLPTYQNIWENACGGGELSKQLEKYGYDVVSTDLIDRGYGIGGVDFLQETELRAPCILTNPPYSLAIEFAEHAVHTLQCEEYYGLYKLTFLESQKRRSFFDRYPPAEVLVFTKRIQAAINGDAEEFKKSSAICYAWFIWRKGFTGSPQIGWL